ncbi:hypothetical protein [Streptomyces sp. NPDC026673]|uniref:hypothetical protein n=1 Tax=Streptomyces sp. NPDC026673 TaxID=3155724 RepID=UPI0033D37C19
MASTVEAAVTTAFATAKGTGPDSTTRAPDDASPTPPPKTAKRTKAADAECGVRAPAAARAPSSSAAEGEGRFAVTVSMPEHCPPALTGR